MVCSHDVPLDLCCCRVCSSCISLWSRQRCLRFLLRALCRDLEQYRSVAKFKFGKRFSVDAIDAFLLDFLNDPEVRATLKVAVPCCRPLCDARCPFSLL